MNPTLEIGTAAVIVALFVAFCAIVGGFFIVPKAVRITTIGAAVMFVGYQVLEFIATEFIVVSIR